MNKYQKQLHKETKELLKTTNGEGTYRGARIFLKRIIKYNPFRPCEDCDRLGCKLTKNKLAYCKYNM